MLAQLKIALLIATFVGYTAGAVTIGMRLERADWLQLEAERNYKLIEDKKFTATLSSDAGKRYEKKRAVIQRKLTTPDRKLDERLQGVGDVVLPGELGVHLNEIGGAHEAVSAASEPR